MLKPIKLLLGEVSDSGASSDDSDAVEGFGDGYGDDLIGDEEDRKRLEGMTEKEREQVLFERIERREALKTRYDVRMNRWILCLSYEYD